MHQCLSQPFILFLFVPRNLSIFLSCLGHQLGQILFLAFGNSFRFHFYNKRSAQVFDRALNRFDCLLQSIYCRELFPDRVNSTSRICSLKYLVGSIGAQHVQRWGHQLRFYWDRFVALILPGPEGLFDSVNAGGCIACELDICPKFDRLRCQPSSDRGGEDGEGNSRDGSKERRIHSFRFAVCPSSVSHRERVLKRQSLR